MQNSFEKGVKEKMDELQFIPSEPVWKNIEKQIRTKKDRRRIILWLPFLCLLLGGGIWWIASTNTETATFATVQEKEKSTESPSSSQKRIDNKEVSETNKSLSIEGISQTGKARSPGLQKRASSQKKEITSAATSFPASHSMTNAWPKRTGEGKTTMEGQGPAIEVPRSKEEFLNNIGINENPEKDKRINTLEPKNNNLGGKSEELNTKDSTVKYKLAEVNRDSSNKAVADVKQLQKITKSAGWQMLYTAGFGVSGITKNLGSFTKSFSSFSEEKALQDASSAGGSNGIPTQPPPTPNYIASPVRTGLSFSLGVAVSKKLNRHFSFSAGVEYNYFSTKMAVGQRNDSLAYLNLSFASSRAFQNTGSGFKDYHNHYHFISLPLAIEWQPSDKLPLGLNAGLSLQQMIATNGLLYDKANNFYYSDKSRMNKMQLFSSFGILYSIANSSRLRLQMGPQLQYGISNLEKNTGSRHLFSLGISAKAFLKNTRNKVQR